MAHSLGFDATLSIRDEFDPRRLEFITDDSISLFDEWWVDEENHTLTITCAMNTNDVVGYLKEVLNALRSFAKYICDDEDAYLIDTDASWPAGWRFVFKNGDVKCYEGMMIFVEEVSDLL